MIGPMTRANHEVSSNDDFQGNQTHCELDYAQNIYYWRDKKFPLRLTKYGEPDDRGLADEDAGVFPTTCIFSLWYDGMIYLPPYFLGAARAPPRIST